MNVMEIFDKGGAVVWILLMYSIVAMVIVIERFITFYLMEKPANGFEDLLRDAHLNNNLKTELAVINGPEARLLQRIYAAKLKNIHDLKSVATRYGSTELRSMERGFRTISILGHTAPLLGLLGTIIGMIKAFMVIEVSGGQVNAQVLAGGIWEAMLTTGVGLAVAIPVLFLLHMLEGIADKKSASMKFYSMMLLETIEGNKSVVELNNNQTETNHAGLVHAV